MPFKLFKNQKTISSIGQKQLNDITGYIETHIIINQNLFKAQTPKPHEDTVVSYPAPMAADAVVMPREKKKRKLEDVISQAEETFQQMLFRLIDEQNISDVDVYKNAHISRKLFSKIRSNAEYKPSKNTCISFAIALNLPLDKALDLLDKAGYTLSNCSKFDLIIKYFIEDENFDLFTINEALHAFDQPLLNQ